MPLLSVVVPFHNVETYIEACLESLRRQTLADLEVILVDDGSADASRAWAEKYCADPRFRIVTQENRGLGPARNTGVSHASGDYLAFVDSDDVVHRDAYALLVGCLATSGSDLAVCGARRFDELGVTPSYVHGLAITGSEQGTHISRRPELVLDRMAWNKVYRRTHWDDAGLAFEPMLFEDYPVSVAAHLRACAVDVVDRGLYYWRSRDSGAPSITQRSAELAAVVDRCASAHQVLDLVEEHAPASLPILREHLRVIDLATVTAAIGANDAVHRERITGLGRRLADRIGEQRDAVASEPRVRIEDAVWHRDELALSLRVDRASGDGSGVTLWLEAPDHRIQPLPMSRGPRAAIRTRLDLGVLAESGPARGFWTLRLQVGDRKLTVLDAGAGRGGFIPARALPGHPDFLVQPYLRGSGFGLLVRRPHVRLSAASAADRTLRLEGRVRSRMLTGELRLLVESGVGRPISLPVELTDEPGRWRRFTAHVPAAAVLADPEQPEPVTVQHPATVALEVGGMPRALVLDPGFRGTGVSLGGRTLTAARNLVGELELVEAMATPTLLAAEWTGDARMLLRGVSATGAELTLVRLADRVEHPVTATAVGGRFRCEVDVRALLRAGRDPSYDENGAESWQPVLGPARTPVTCARDTFAALAEPRIVDGHRVALTRAHGDALRITVER